jgi:TolA-binding protein
MSNTLCRWVSQKITKPPTEYLLEHEKLIVDEHVEECVHCWELQQIAAQSALWKSLNPPELSPFVEKRIITAALEGRMPQKNRDPLFSGWLRPALAIAAGALALAVAFVFLLSPDNTNPIDGDKSGGSAAIAVKNTSSKTYNLLHFKKTSPVKLMRSDKVWGTENAIVNLQVLSGPLTRIELIQGKIVAEVTKRSPGEKFEVVGPAGVVEVVGTIFSVEVDDMGIQRVRVLRGEVNVRETDSGKVQPVKKDRTYTIGTARPVPATIAELDSDRALMEAGVSRSRTRVSTKAEPHRKRDARAVSSVSLASKAIDEKRLMEARHHIDEARQSSPKDQDVPELYARLARAYRQQKNYTAAQNIYQKLMTEYASSNAARNAIVALGQLELNALGDPQAALAHFDVYLTRLPSGYLAEAAWVGKARSLERLGERNALREAANQYLNKYRNGSFVGEMLLYRGRINADSGKCGLAKKDYEAIIQRWPDSRKARDARQGLVTCGAR